MKIHEYQGKQILRQFGVPVLAGQPATTPEQAVQVAGELPGPVWVVKSQIHAGGRGKGRFVEQSTSQQIQAAASGNPLDGPGGVQLARSVQQVGEVAASMLGNRLVTKQTNAAGKQVNTVYVEQGCAIASELYAAVTLDRSVNRLVVMVSAQGGMDIEDVAHNTPEAIHKAWVDPVIGLGAWQGRALATHMGLTGKAVRRCGAFLQQLVGCYRDMDCDMLEINPLVITNDDQVVALDCKLSVDDNALYRHLDVLALRDLSEEDPAEIEASKVGLSFISLDGDIGCLVNGAGLAMATMDIIQYKGGSPANFLDVGGGASESQVTDAFRIITRDPNVKAILVNIFGGIMKCDVIANGVLAAVQAVGLSVPLVVRLSGTNAELGQQIIAESGLNVITAQNLDQAGELAVQAAQTTGV